MSRLVAAIAFWGVSAVGQGPVEAKIAAAVQEVDASRIEATVRKLCSFGTRHVLSRTDSDAEGTGAARRWLKAQYEEIAAATEGRMTVRFQEATMPCLRNGLPRAVKVVNVIATLRGATDAEGRRTFNPLVALSIMIFFALCSQCAATLGVIRRETRSWRWPVFTFTYMTVFAWIAAVLVYQVGSAMGYGL